MLKAELCVVGNIAGCVNAAFTPGGFAARKGPGTAGVPNLDAGNDTLVAELCNGGTNVPPPQRPYSDPLDGMAVSVPVMSAASAERSWS